MHSLGRPVATLLCNCLVVALSTFVVQMGRHQWHCFDSRWAIGVLERASTMYHPRILRNRFVVVVVDTMVRPQQPNLYILTCTYPTPLHTLPPHIICNFASPCFPISIMNSFKKMFQKWAYRFHVLLIVIILINTPQVQRRPDGVA